MSRIINENGMTMKLVQFLNESKSFKEKFLGLFNFETENVDYIDFTGYTKTDYGMPDITIRYNNGEYTYIEVKTNANTAYQENQKNDNSADYNKESAGYIKLIKEQNRLESNNVKFIEKHFGFLLDKYHCENFTKIKIEDTECNIPTVSWNKVHTLLKDFGRTDLVRDIEDNVDGILDYDVKMQFTAYDMALLYNAKLLVTKINNILGMDLNGNKIDTINETNLFPLPNQITDLRNRENEISTKIEKYLIPLKNNNDNKITYSGKVEHYIYDYNNQSEVWGAPFGAYYNYGNKKDQIFYGYNPDLIDYNVDNKFLFGIALSKDIVDMTKLKKGEYYVDQDRWIYIPITIKTGDTSGKCPCAAVTLDEEHILDTCHAIRALYKVQKLVEITAEDIVEEANRKLGSKNNYKLVLGAKLNYCDALDTDADLYKGEEENRKFKFTCGRYIDVKTTKVNEDRIIIGMNPNVMNEKIGNGQVLNRHDYNLSIGINSDHFKLRPQNDKGKEKDEQLTIKDFKLNNWMYYPICRKTLCVPNYEETFKKKAVEVLCDILGNYNHS